MVSNRLIDTRVELLTGSALVESDDVVKDTSVTIVCQKARVTMPKIWHLSFQHESRRNLRYIRVRRKWIWARQHVSVATGKMMMLSGESAALQRFDVEETDFLDHWNQQRSEYVAMANVSAAKSLVGSS